MLTFETSTRKIPITELASMMEDSNEDEERRTKDWEMLTSEHKDAVENIVSEMLIGMTKDFSWLPNAIDFDPNERTLIDVKLSFVMNDVINAAFLAESERLNTVSEVRVGTKELLEDL